MVTWLELDNAVNVRDLGGLPTDGGALTRSGRLIRSDNLQDLSPADVTLLVHELGVSTVIDLRSNAEVRAEGPGPLAAVASVTHVRHSMLPESDGMTDVAAEAMATGRQRARDRDAGDLLTGFYLGYLEDRPDSVTGALRAIATAPGAALVHCAAGKDRTGVVAALALTAVGVPAETVIADYTATGSRIEAILDRLRSSPTYADDVDQVSTDEHRPRAESMTRFLRAVATAHGGVLAWLETHGFTDGDLLRLRAKLLG